MVQNKMLASSLQITIIFLLHFLMISICLFNEQGIRNISSLLICFLFLREVLTHGIVAPRHDFYYLNPAHHFYCELPYHRTVKYFNGGRKSCRSQVAHGGLSIFLCVSVKALMKILLTYDQSYMFYFTHYPMESSHFSLKVPVVIKAFLLFLLCVLQLT